MRVEFVCEDLLLEGLLSANVPAIERLLVEWGASKEKLPRLAVQWELKMWPPLFPRSADYYGERNSVHLVRLGVEVLWKSQLRNEAAAHELRHMFWNIVAPGEEVREDGFRFRPPETPGGQKEEDDCRVAGERYQNRNLLGTTRHFESFEDFLVFAAGFPS